MDWKGFGEILERLGWESEEAQVAYRGAIINDLKLITESVFFDDFDDLYITLKDRSDITIEELMRFRKWFESIDGLAYKCKGRVLCIHLDR